MPVNKITQKELRQIETSVRYFTSKKYLFQNLAQAVYRLLSSHPLLQPYVHSLKYRVKDESRLREKLIEKAIDAREKGKRFTITDKNLFEHIGDLAGVRLLHLHTTEMQSINEALVKIFEEQEYKIIGGPTAITWDDEYRQYFRELNIRTESYDSMYTSVHYLIKTSPTSKIRCELQVRTLVEEVWGEVSHRINYPQKTESIACQEQLKVLARISSGCTRLVDSIFKSLDEHSVRLSSNSKPDKKRHKVI